jgi:ATP-dependent RNA helicase RhlE
MATWEELGLTSVTIELLNQAGLKTPTPIQEASIPIALEGSDLIASAQTGTGKTASFVLPMIERLKGKEGTLGLILAPTREIAQQIQAVFDTYGTPQKVRSIVLIGGVEMKQDQEAISTYPQVIVATPGRLCDHLDRGNLWMDFIQWVVLDEADRMLDMGFSLQISKIMKDIPESAQTLVFSATISPSVERLSKGILYKPKYVSVGKSNSAAVTVEQKIIWMKEESKGSALRRLLEEEKGTVVVFTRSKDAASRLFRSLHSRNFSDVTVIHSDLRQMDREQSLADFKEGKYRILIATDIAGRGIHVEGIAHVVNYDLPREPEDYVHRIGRTGRNQATGKATSFATPRDQGVVRAIEKLVRGQITAEFMDGIQLGQPSGAPSRSPHSNQPSQRRGRRPVPQRK